MTPATFAFLADFVKQRSGLVLTADKQYLLETRLLPIARKNNMNTLDDLAGALKTRQTGDLATSVVEAMTTNETFFFRDNTPFENFANVILPDLMARGGSRRVRIWCAAASSGQEPYSLAMQIKEMGAKAAGWSFEIIGTDIDTEILNRAKAGTYSQFEVQRGLPVQMLLKYFTQTGDTWQISSEIRSMVQYRPLNLLRDFSTLGKFDVIFCRNVLIYFDQAAKADVLGRLSSQLQKDGYLLLGAAETVVGITTRFQSVPGRRGLYQANDGAAPAAMVRPRLSAV
ncbi:MAG: protein-glutamate O-methyltransferase CheR [Rhodobiaceae bacterium]|nr:protein-glutamate O-methyltransferase CheR [Rhodobiaceae bacterium]